MSVNCLPGKSPKAVARASRLPNPTLCATTVGRIQALGYDVCLDPGRKDGHANVQFEAEPSDEELETLRRVFGSPIRNDWRRKKGWNRT